MRPILIYDTECSPDYWMVGFLHPQTGRVRQYELFEGNPLNHREIVSIMREFTLVSFNGVDYDTPMLTYALLAALDIEKGKLGIAAALANLKRLSDHIIMGKLRSWQVEQEYGFKIPAFVDQIDLMEPVPGVQISLKLYGARLHSKRLQDLPYGPHESVFLAEDGFPHAEDRRAKILAYNVNDLHTTHDLWKEARKPGNDIIQTRIDFGAEFNLDVRSKSDAQMAEAAIKTRVSALKGEKLYPTRVSPGTTYRYQAPDFLRFKTETMKVVLATMLAAPFVVAEAGNITMPPQVADLRVQMGQSVYKMGIGGLHSTESRRAIFANERVLLRDFDVTSYYPALILKCGLFPPSMGDLFQTVYREFFERRLTAKKTGNASLAQTLKIVLNGTYGKLGSRFSVLYAPNLLIQVTITGQLALLMLIERMELAGIPCVSANTDGIVLACPADLEARMYEIAREWERDTGLGLEDTPYTALLSRDVNTYLAVKPGGKVKAKGDLAPSDAQHNPWFEITKQAVYDFVAKGVPVAETIIRCRDVRQFVAVQKVNGGAQMPTRTSYVDDWVEVMPREWVRLAWIRSGQDYLKSPVKRKSRPAPVLVTSEAEYLGKVVRWIRSTKSNQHIERVKGGAKVSESDNARPLMTLPDEFPDDIDYLFYIEKANAMLKDIGL